MPTLLPERTATKGLGASLKPLPDLPIPNFCNKICTMHPRRIVAAGGLVCKRLQRL